MERLLAVTLTYGLLHFPVKLLEEIPLILSSLEAGEVVNIDAISDTSYKQYMHVLMSYLPVKKVQQGYYKNESIKSITGSILFSLLKSKSIVQPPALSSSQVLSCRTVPLYLLISLKEYPELIYDIPILLQKLLCGDSIQLNGIDNGSIKAILVKIFQSLGIKEEGEEEFTIPSNDAATVTFAIEAFLRIFTVSDQCNDDRIVKAKVGEIVAKTSNSNKKSKKRSRSASSESSIGSSHTSSSTSSDADSDANDSTQRVSIGPKVPSQQLLTSAKLASEKYKRIIAMQQQEMDNDNDDEIGPSMPSNTTYDSTLESVDYLCNNTFPLPYKDTNSATTTTTGSVIEGREEWMMTPGENKTFANFGASMEVTNRKFQLGKDAKKYKNKVILTEEELIQQQQQHQLAQQEILEYNQSRGASLMEQHLDKINSGKDKRSGQAVDGNRKGFDREKDFTTHRALSKIQAEQLVKEAKSLDSRFSTSTIQRSSI